MIGNVKAVTVQRDPQKNWVSKHDILREGGKSSSVQTSTIEKGFLIEKLEVGVPVGRCMAQSRVYRMELED